MNKIAFLTTIYPVDESFVDDFFCSLSKQTKTSFDIILANDGFLELEKFKHKYHCLNILEIEPAKSIAKNREILIKYAIDNSYDIAVFGDIDDYFDWDLAEFFYNKK